MAMVPGTRIGPYEVFSPLGAGGMGEAYRARDTRLGRDVAIKVLARGWNGDAAIRDRFQREARVLSRLNHPNVCTVHDVGTHDGTDYLVMELIEGETLAARLQQGPLRLDRALEIARQIAAALAISHRAGVVHRDLKPGNVMLTPDGAKLLDFGIARVSNAQSRQSADTVAETLTAGGALLGTFPYMSPEQLEGREVDARSDIFSFGVVLYQMIAGRRPFDADTNAGVMAAILKEDPAPLGQTAAVPQALDALIASCLQKDPDKRWHSAQDLVFELTWIADRLKQAPALETRPRRLTALWLAAALAIGALFALALQMALRHPAPEPQPVRAEVPAPPDAQFISMGLQSGPVAITEDGRRLAFVASGADGRIRVWIRSLDTTAAQPLSGTESASSPFWSPDGSQIAFFADRKLKKIVLGNGAVTSLADIPYGAGGTWNRQGTIIFSAGGGLSRIAADRGSARPLTTPDRSRGELGHLWPSFLPDGQRADPRETPGRSLKTSCWTPTSAARWSRHHRPGRSCIRPARRPRARGSRGSIAGERRSASSRRRACASGRNCRPTALVRWSPRPTLRPEMSTSGSTSFARVAARISPSTRPRS